MMWYGWLRRDRRHHYQRVIGPCSSIGECSRLLGAEARKRGILDRHCCMTQGNYPRDVQEALAATHQTHGDALAGAEPVSEPSEACGAVPERNGAMQ